MGKGVSRYDGKTFTDLSRLNELQGIWKVLADRHGNLWFGSGSHGVSRYDGKNVVSLTVADGLAHQFVTYLLEDSQGNIWFGTWGGGVSRYDGQAFNNLTTHDGLVRNRVYSILEDHEGNLWFGTDRGVSKYDGQRFTNFTKSEGLAGDHVRDMTQDDKGMLWFGTRGGVSRYDGKTFTTFTKQDGLPPGTTVDAMHKDSRGNIWFAVSAYLGKGVIWYDGEVFHTLTQEDGLSNNAINCIYEDREGHLWFGHNAAGGVSKFDPQSFTNFNMNNGLAGNEIVSLFEDSQGNIWFGTWGGGVSKYDGKRFINFTKADGLAENYVHCIIEDNQGYLWFGTNGGVSRYDGKTFTSFTTQNGLVGNNIFALLQDSKGVLWFGARYGGISRYDGDSFANLTVADGLASDEIQCFLEDSQGHLWIGTWGGVSWYDGEKFTNYAEQEGLVSNVVRSMLEDSQGRIWFGTMAGVSQYQLSGENEESHGKSFKAVQELDGEFVVAMVEDRNGQLWFGSKDGGIVKYDGKTFTTLTAADGLASNAVGCIMEDSKGRLWFGTGSNVDIGEGVSMHIPNRVAPPVYIHQVVADKVVENPATVEIPAGVGHVEIAYHTVSFKTRPGQMQYIYKLEGRDNDWNPPTKAESVDYLNLKPGTYTFSVKAVDRDLNYSEPAYVTLNVVPPWYLNGWIAIPSLGAILALLIGFIVLGYRYYAQRREAQRLERESQQLRDQMLEQERQSRQEVEAKNEQISELNEQLQDENLRMAAELEITERIQRMILPSADELQAIAELDIAGYMEPADDVGGDYYDVLQREGMVAISIGDVTGHGLESGLVMLMTQTAVQALLQSGETDPVHFLDTLNRTIYNNVQRMDSDKNLTLCLLDYQSGELKLSGQHEEMIVVRRDGTVELVDTVDLGFPIGLDDDIAAFIDQTTMQLQPGDGVALYTDGITEAENTAGEQYGLERLCEVVSQHWSQSAEAIKDAVITDVRQHIGEQEVYDDITLVVLKQK